MNPFFTAELVRLHHEELQQRPHHRTSRPGRKTTIWRPDAKPMKSI